MKKHLNKIILATVFVIIFAITQVHAIVLGNNIADSEAKVVNPIIIPSSLLIDESIEILVNNDRYLDADETIKIGELKEVKYKDGAVVSITIVTNDEVEVEYECSKLKLIDIKSDKIYSEDGMDAIELVFRTGGKAQIATDDVVRMYQTEKNGYSLDPREHKGAEFESISGEVIDFRFTMMKNKRDDIIGDYIFIKDSDGKIVQLQLCNMDIKTIMSHGKMQVQYIGKIGKQNIFEVKEATDFAMEIQMNDGTTLTLSRGSKIDLVQNYNKGYWEIPKVVDDTRHEATVKDIVFGYDDVGITSIDYIVFLLEDESEVFMTMMQTKSLYAIPHGNYHMIYKYVGEESTLAKVEPAEDWNIDLFYSDENSLSLNIGATASIYKNIQGIWTIDPVEDEADQEKEDQ